MYILDTHIVPEGISPSRLSDYACGIFPNLPTRKSVKKAIKRGEIWVNEQSASTGFWVQTGHKIELTAPELTQQQPYVLPLNILFEDDHIALINKPAGIPTSGNRFRTTQNALMYNLSPSPDENALPRPIPVHRLDASTSGLLLIAKTRMARIHLGQQFEEKKIEKKYQAIVIGQTSEKGQIHIPIDGKEAMTTYERVKSVPSLKNQWLSLLDLYPQTGRTHQLRIHLSEIGHPILGDKLYGHKGFILRNKGLFLAAVALSFIHPATKKTIRISIEPPNKFITLMDREVRRWRKYHHP